MVSKPGTTRIDLDYMLSGDDCIERVCPGWSRAGRKRMGQRLDDEMVLGRPLWDFINGGATLRLYDALVWHVRKSGKRISFRHRGDRPGALRYMRMTLTPGLGERVHLRSECLHEQSTPRAVYFTHVTYRRNPELILCSICQMIEANGRWFNLSEMLEHTTLLDSLAPVEVGDTVCESCKTRLEMALGVVL